MCLGSHEFTVNELSGLGIHKDYHNICYVTLKMETLSTSTMTFPVPASKIGRPMYSYTDANSQTLLEDCIMKADTTIGIIDCSDLRGKGQSHTYYIDIFYW